MAVTSANVPAGGPESPRIEVRAPFRVQEWLAIAGLLQEYVDSVGVDLAFQGIAQELASLPGEYAPPRGGFLAAWIEGELAGCVAFRDFPDADVPNACEMKRLYVRPAYRRWGLGRTLSLRIMDQALQAGYSSMLLDTLDEMEAARELYQSLGFTEIPPYYYNPIAGSHYLKVSL